MKVLRVYTGDDERSHFEDLEIPEEETASGWMTGWLDAVGLAFRRTPPSQPMDFHRAPRRQLMLVLYGALEVECGDGSVRRIGPGELLLADDLTGQGHISREVESPRAMAFIAVAPDLDVSAWRSPPA